jgi:hypothetical protein
MEPALLTYCVTGCMADPRWLGAMFDMRPQLVQPWTAWICYNLPNQL